MQIKKIYLKNFGKHKENEFDLEPVTIIKGSNGSGKSTILEGISYGLTGSIRRLPKKLDSIAKLSNGAGNLSVRLDTDENIITRDLSQKGAKFSETVNCSSCESTATNTEKQLYLKTRYGLDELIINPANFIALNGADKSKYILDLLSDINNDSNKVIDTITSSFGNDPFVLEFFEKYNKSLGLIENLDNIKDSVNVKKKVLNKELKNNSENTFRIAEIKGEIGSIDSSTGVRIPELEKDINELKVAIKFSDENLVKFKKQQNELNLLKANYPKVKKDMALLDKHSKELYSRLEELKNKKFDSTLQGKFNKVNDELLKIKEDGLVVKSKIELVNSKIVQVVELLSKIGDVGNSKRCVIDSNIICTNKFDNAINKIKKELVTLKDDLTNLQNSRNVLASKYRVKKGEVTELEELLNKTSKEKDDNTNEIVKLTSMLAENENKRRNLVGAFEKINVLEEAIQSVIVEDTSMQKKILISKEKDLIDLKATDKNIIELKHNLKLAEIEDMKIEEKTIQLETLKSLEKSIKKEKLKLLEDGITPFSDKMVEIFKAMNFDYEVFAKNDGKKATIGLKKNGYDIEIDMLSTGETMMFLIGLIGAIYDHNKNNFRLLVLDDLDNLDGENLNKLFSNVSNLKAYFDNILLIGILENFDLSKYNLNVINL